MNLVLANELTLDNSIMVLDTILLSNTVSSFKDFLNNQISSKESTIISNIKEDMRHFLRLVKYREDITLKEITNEINDALEELYSVIVIQMNAIDMNNFNNKGKDSKPTDKTNSGPNNSKNPNQNILVIKK